MKVSNCTDLSDINCAIKDLHELEDQYRDSETLAKLWSKFLAKKARLLVKEGVRILRRRTGELFEFVNYSTTPFGIYTSANLKSLKTGRIQSFNKDTYHLFFKEI